jgi:hypothetical protein
MLHNLPQNLEPLLDNSNNNALFALFATQQVSLLYQFVSNQSKTSSKKHAISLLKNALKKVITII